MCIVFFLSVFLMPNLWANPPSLPDLPPNPCYSGCTPEMERIWNEFLAHPHAPQANAQFFSGECRYQSTSLNPDTIHYASLLWDKREDGSPFFATEFGFFYEVNPWQLWDLARARYEMSPSWKKLRTLVVNEDIAHAFVLNDDKAIVYAYWFRQNPDTKKLYYISYWVGFMHAFCELNQQSAE